MDPVIPIMLKQQKNKDQNAVHLREACVEDLESIAAMMLYLGYPISLPRLKEILHRIMSDPEIDVFLAIDSANCAVGLISLRSFPVLRLGGEQVSIEELVIAPEYRGMGIGEGLVNFAKHYARQKGAVRLEVLMNKNREGFHRNFYGKSGFEMAQNAVYRISLVKEKHT